MPETPPAPIQRRRRSPKPLSQVDMIMQRNQQEARRIAVLEYVAEQLAECNARLASVGIEVRPAAPARPAVQPPPHATNGAAEGHALGVPQRWEPCVWCGGGKPTKAYSVGNGLVQYLCATDAWRVSASRQTPTGNGIAEQAVRSMTDSTEPTYNPIQQPNMNARKTIMQPTEADMRAAQQPVNAPADEESFEEVPDGEVPEES